MKNASVILGLKDEECSCDISSWTREELSHENEI